METQKNIISKVNENKKIKVLVVILGCGLSIYLGISLFFMNHFIFGSKINGINVTANTTKQVENSLTKQMKGYKLTLKESDGKQETINAKDIDLKYNSDGKVNELLKKQNAFAWVVGIFNSKSYNISQSVQYNKDKLSNVISNLDCIKNKNVIKPVSAYLKYKDGSYQIVPQIEGNIIKNDILYKKVEGSIEHSNKILDLSQSECYEQPKYKSDSKELISCLDTLKKYMKTKVTFSNGDTNDVVDKDTINKWIDIDTDFNITVNPDKVRTYVDKLASKFNTYGEKRSFKTTLGTVITLEPGDYGWIVNKKSTIANLIEYVQKGQTVETEPEFAQKAASNMSGNDYGNSYVEINLSKQHLWVYKDGQIKYECDFVSGNVSTGNATPGGIYFIKYKESPAKLKGEDYETSVTYWMPFNNNIGMHDSSSWRSEFGGNIYLTNGSHGCINLSYDSAEQIYNVVSSGYPVICYYQDNQTSTDNATGTTTNNATTTQ